MNEIKLNEKTQTKLAMLIKSYAEAQERIQATIQTILDINDVDGNWNFPVDENKIDITRLVKIEDKKEKNDISAE